MRPPFTKRTAPVYRGHHPKWSHDPESGAGAARHGGRFNRPGLSCLYTSASPETAWLEAQQGFAFKAQPLTLCAYDVACENVLDLTDAAIRKAVDVTLEDMAYPWETMAAADEEPPSWRVADRLIAMGTAAILTPSFASQACANDVNVVFWTWGREGPHRLQVIDDHGRLPRDDRSWR